MLKIEKFRLTIAGSPMYQVFICFLEELKTPKRHFKFSDLMFFILSIHYTGLWKLGADPLGVHPKILADQLTWSQLGWGTDYTHHITKYWSSRIFRPSSYSPSKVITVSPLDRNLPVNPTGALLKYSLFGFVIWKSNLELTLHRTPWRTVW